MRQMDGTPGQPTPMDAALLMMRLLYAALLGSVAVYVVIANVIRFGEGPPPETSATLGLAVAGGVIGLCAPLLRRLLMPARAPARPSDPPPTHISPKGFARTFTAHIVGWGLCEGVVVVGLVMAFLTHDAHTLYPFAGGAVLMFLFLAPRRAELEAVARAEEQAHAAQSG